MRVEAIARQAGFDGNAEELVRQAFEAIFRGQADEVAYSVTKAAGADWLTPDIWYKEQTKVNAEQARELLAQGKKDNTYEAPIPEDDAKAISEADDLVEMAETAWNQHVRGPEVEILLRMAANFAGDKAPSQDGPKEEVITPQPKAEDPSPEPQEKSEAPSGETPAETSAEPWEGYDQEKVSDIIAGINAGATEYTQEEFVNLMGDVWAYETARPKGARKTILDRLDAIAAKLQAGEPITEAGDGATEGGGGDPVGSTDAPEGTSEEPSEAPADEAPQAEQGQSSGSGAPESPEAEAEKPVEEEKPKRQRRKRGEEKPPEDEGDPDYEKLMQKVEDDLERERIHKPKKPEEDVPDLPWDWTKMTDKELQQFYGMYAAVAYYKGYVLSREDRRALHCKAAADELHNTLLVHLDKYDEHGKEKKVALIEAEVESDENIVKWRRRQRKHETFAASHRNERDSVGKLLEALSRIETMRQQEWERSGKLNRQK